jgi:solute carrier family 25 citrate transporter 1
MQYPFEFAKTRLQLRDGPRGTKNPLVMIRQIVTNEGIGALYTGCSTLILGTIFKASVRFMSFDAIKNTLSDDNGKLTPFNGVLAGMVAGCVESVVAVTPTERVKTAL